MTTWDLKITNRYQAHISYQHTPKKFGGPEGHNWTLRNRLYSRNIVLPGMNGTWTSLKECKRRARLAYLLWFTVTLLRGTDDPTIIGREFFDV